MAISSLSSSSPRFSAPSLASTGSTNKSTESSKSTGDQSKAQLQNISELMKAIEQLLKSLKQDGFDSKSGGAGGGSPAGGAGGGSPAGGAGGGSPAGGAGGGGASQAGGAAQGGQGGVDASGEQGPQDLAHDSPTQADPKTTAAGGADKVAKDIEKEAEGWHYDNSGGQSFDNAMKQSKIEKPEKGGVCTDMAVAAARRFEKAGIDARVVDGEVKDKNGSGGGMHAWVQYKGDDGQWKEMDPTVAACSKDAPGALDPKHNNEFNYGSVQNVYEVPHIG